MRTYFLSIVISLFLISCGMEEIPTYKLELTVSPSEGGKLNVSPTLPMYPKGNTVTITPEPNEHWVFKQWEGDGSGSSTTLQLTMDSNKSVIGVFVKRDYPLKITITGEGTVEEKIITNSGGREYPHGTNVELTPKPKVGWAFESWGGDLIGTETPKTIKVDKEKNVTVKFKEIPKFFLHENGITCLCPDTKPGDKGLINGIEFESVDNDFLRKRRDEGKDLSRVCTSLVTDMSNVFFASEYRLSPQFNQNISSWDVGNVVTMKQMFFGAEIFNQPIGKWDVRKVKTMELMFGNNKNFNQPLNDWKTNSLENSRFIFSGAEKFNQPLNNWNTSLVTNMEGVFWFAKSFNQPIGNWNVSNVTSMFGMFYSAENFNQPIINWNVSNVKNMGWMFNTSKSFDQPIGIWSVKNVTNMELMFANFSNFNQPLNNWDVSNVTNMNAMFSGNIKFNQPLDKWDVGKVEKMNGVFAGTLEFNQSLESWKVANVSLMDGMFKNATKFNQNLSKWCVTKILSEPKDFSLGSKMISQNLPKWGTCPD